MNKSWIHTVPFILGLDFGAFVLRSQPSLGVRYIKSTVHVLGRSLEGLWNTLNISHALSPSSIFSNALKKSQMHAITQNIMNISHQQAAPCLKSRVFHSLLSLPYISPASSLPTSPSRIRFRILPSSACPQTPTSAP